MCKALSLLRVKHVIRLGKLTDYGVLLMCQVARSPEAKWHTARELAEQCRLPVPTVGKLLRMLLRSGLLTSHRGVNGGYVLARSPELIVLTEIISAFEGPFALTQCGSDVGDLCNLESSCPVRDNQRIISQAIRGALERVTLADLTRPLHLTAIRDGSGNLVPTLRTEVGRTQ
jgi:FeS assembly SUF system regulator